MHDDRADYGDCGGFFRTHSSSGNGVGRASSRATRAKWTVCTNVHTVAPSTQSGSGGTTRAISLRVDEQVLDRLRSLAQRRGARYQTLLKQFVVERLYEEEQREMSELAARRARAAWTGQDARELR